MAAVIRIRGWDRFQHYKDRDPPWVKLYRDLLTTESWVLGTDLSRLVQVASILLAARYSNSIPLNFPLIRKVASLDCNEKQFMEAISHLAKDFLEIQQCTEDPKPVAQHASSVLATCPSEAEQRQSRAEAEQTRGATSARSLQDEFPGIDEAAWNDWTTYRTKSGKPIKPASRAKAIAAFVALGDGQRAAVDNSIANGYQGLFAPKAGTSERTRLLPPKTRYEAAQDKLRAYAAERGEVLGVDEPDFRPALGGQLRGGTVAALEAGHRGVNGGSGPHDVRADHQIRLGASANVAGMHGDGDEADDGIEHLRAAAEHVTR